MGNIWEGRCWPASDRDLADSYRIGAVMQGMLVMASLASLALTTTTSSLQASEVLQELQQIGRDYKKQASVIYWQADAAGLAGQVQGEYKGDYQGQVFGAQVAALGRGTYRLVLYPGGLPGDGWHAPEPYGPKRVDLVNEAFGRLSMGRIVFSIMPLSTKDLMAWQDEHIVVTRFNRKPKDAVVYQKVSGPTGPAGVYGAEGPAGKHKYCKGSAPLRIVVSRCGEGFRARSQCGESAPEADLGSEWGYELFGEEREQQVVFDIGGDGMRALWTASGLQVNGPNGATVLKKVLRRSPTLGKAPPETASVLFAGKGVTEWIVPEDRMQQLAAFVAKTGCLPPGIRTRGRFDSFRLHLEMQFGLHPTARHRRRCAGGIILQGRYEADVTDSFGVVWHDQHPTQLLALYNLGTGDTKHAGVHWPRINASLPPLSWQGIDIEFMAARFRADDRGRLRVTRHASVSMWLNGVQVFDKMRIKRSGPYCDKQGPEPGPLVFQGGSGHRFRNIWIEPIEDRPAEPAESAR